MKLLLRYFDEVQANSSVPSPRCAAERGNPTNFVALPHQFCDDFVTIH